MNKSMKILTLASVRRFVDGHFAEDNSNYFSVMENIRHPSDEEFENGIDAICVVSESQKKWLTEDVFDADQVKSIKFVIV